MVVLQAVSLLVLVGSALSVDLASYALPFVRIDSPIDALHAEADNG